MKTKLHIMKYIRDVKKSLENFAYIILDERGFGL